MTSTKTVQFSRFPTPLSIYVQNFSTPLTLDVQFQTPSLQMITNQLKENIHRFFYKNSFYKNHQAQNCQKTKNILRIMARLKYMINNLESLILILHQESTLFTMECLLFTIEGLQFRKTCVQNQPTNQSKHS